MGPELKQYRSVWVLAVLGFVLVLAGSVSAADDLEAAREKLVSGYSVKTYDDSHMEEMGQYCKALAASGNPAYAEVLSMVAEKSGNSRLKRHCRNAAFQLPVYAQRKESMAAAGSGDLSEDESRLISMVRSKDALSMRSAAKTVCRRHFEGDEVTDAISQELLIACTETGGDRYLVDALSWMCKALGLSGKEKYRATLERVADIGTSDKLKKYARKSLRML